MSRIACVYSVQRYVTPESPLVGWQEFPFGLGLIAACLERAGHDVRLWVICPGTRLDRVANEIVHEFGCDLLAVTAVTTQFPIIARLCEQVKRVRPSVTTLLGGHYASLAPEEAIASPWIDAICIGEGEKAAVAFADALDRNRRPAAIPGVWIKLPGERQIDRTPPDPFETELDDLPFLNRRKWEPWVSSSNEKFAIVIGRGCPFGCGYCSNSGIKSTTTGTYVRFRSPENIIAELTRLVNDFPETNTVYLEVETIGGVPGFAVRLCEQLAEFNDRRAKPIEFGTNLAVTGRLADNADAMHALFSAFQRANLTTLNIGSESGSERIRKSILNRPRYTNDQLIGFCKLARRYGIKIGLYLLIGLPSETIADYLETVAVARECEPDRLHESIFYPYPGTDLFKLSADLKLFDPARIDKTAERSRACLDLDGFPRWRIFFEYLFITWRVFHGRRSIFLIGERIVYKMFSAMPASMSLIYRLRTLYTKLRRRAVPTA